MLNKPYRILRAVPLAGLMVLLACGAAATPEPSTPAGATVPQNAPSGETSETPTNAAPTPPSSSTEQPTTEPDPTAPTEITSPPTATPPPAATLTPEEEELAQELRRANISPVG